MKTTRWFIFVFNDFLFQENLSVSCVIKWKIMLPLYNNQISLLTVFAIIHGLLYNDHLSITTTETLSHKWSLNTGLTVTFTICNSWKKFKNSLWKLPKSFINCKFKQLIWTLIHKLLLIYNTNYDGKTIHIATMFVASTVYISYNRSDGKHNAKV